MTSKQTCAALSCFLLLTACSLITPSKPKPDASKGGINDMNSTLEASDAAALSADLKMKAQAGKLKANIDAARSEASALPDSVVKKVVEGELTVAQSRLAGVDADPVEVEAAKQRRQLATSGRLEDLAKAYSEAELTAKQLSTELAAARLAAVKAREERDKQKLLFMEELERNKAENEKAIQALKDQVMRDQVRQLNYAAAVCLALALGVFGVGFAFGGVATLPKLLPIALLLGTAALLCFGLAQLVGQWWFKWACAAAAAALGTWVMVWGIKHYKQGDLKAEAEAKAKSFKTALQTVVPVLDDAWDNANGEIKTFLSQHVFEKLKGAMDNTDKKTIHEIRSTLKS